MLFNVLDLLPLYWYCNAKIRKKLKTELGITERSLTKIISRLLEKNESLNQQLENARKETDEWVEYSIEISEEGEAAKNSTLLQLAEKIAAESERGMEVLRSVNRYLEERAAAQREKTRREIINHFPIKIIAGNMKGYKFVYEQSFIDDLRKRPKKDQHRLRFALQKFSKHGEHYSSLDTHAIHDDWIDCLPEGSSSSRASDELRFFWKDKNKEVHLYFFGKKGEKWL